MPKAQPAKLPTVATDVAWGFGKPRSDLIERERSGAFLSPVCAEGTAREAPTVATDVAWGLGKPRSDFLLARVPR